jgi:tetratricopeptide (TPR) repeat protein
MTHVTAEGIEALPDDHRERYEAILDELEPLAEHKPEQALDYVNQILGHIPDDDSYDRLRGALLAQRASLELDVGRDASAREDVERALELGWHDLEAHVTAGWAHYATDRTGRARDYFDDAIEVDPDHVPALTGRALALMEIDELELALADLTHALHLSPDDPELHSLRGEVHVRRQELDRAEDDIRKARQLAPGDPEYALASARLMTVQGETDEAREAIEAAIHQEAGLESLLLYSYLLLLGGEGEEARRYAIRASNQYPDEAFAFVQLVHVELAEGNVSLAKKAADRAVKLDPSLPDGYMVRGATLQMMGDREEAREDMERARQAPAELPMFLLGEFYEEFETSGFHRSMMDLLEQYSASPAGETSAETEAGAGAGPGMPPPGMGDMDPASMMGEMFDESGELDDRVKPLLEMALKNAPNILEQMPSSMLERFGGIDPDRLEDIDFSELDSDDIEAQMKQLHQMLESGQNPFDLFGGGGFDPSDLDPDDFDASDLDPSDDD